MTTRVAVVGAAGRMGRAVRQAVEAAEDLELGALVDPALASVDVAGSSVPVHASVRDLAEGEASVAVDFTRPDVVATSAGALVGSGVDVVVGTSGLAGDVAIELGRRYAEHAQRLFVVPNFAVGAVLAMRFAEMAARWMDGAEIIELHHEAKRDAPSGTALATAERIEAARRASGRAWPEDPTVTEHVPGSRGARVGAVRVHSVRLSGLVAHQEVCFGGPGETLTIRHDSLDRRSFLPGVLLAIRRIATLPVGLSVGLDAVMDG